MNYEIQIGEVNLINFPYKKPAQRIQITQDQFHLIEQLANIKRTASNETIYVINDLELKIIPVVYIEEQPKAIIDNTDYNLVIEQISKCENIGQLDKLNEVSKGNHESGIAFAKKAAKLLSPKEGK